MEPIFSNLVDQFINGKLSRRGLIQSLAAAATVAGAPATAGAAAAGRRDFKAIAVNHISYQSKDYGKARDFYSQNFGMQVNHDNGKQCYLQFGQTILIVRQASSGPTPLIDHVAYTISDYGKDGVDPAQGGLRRRRLRKPLDGRDEIGVDQLDLGAELQGQHVPIEGGQVQQRPVERVTLGASRARALPFLQIAQSTGDAAGASPASAAGVAQRLFERGGLSGVQRIHDRCGIVTRGLDQVGRGGKASADGGDLCGQLQAVASTSLHLRIVGQPPGATDVGLRGARRESGHRSVDALSDQVFGQFVDARDAQGEQPAARPDGRQQVLLRRRAEKPNRARWGLLDGLEQRVERLLGEAICVLDDQHLPAATRRCK